MIFRFILSFIASVVGAILVLPAVLVAVPFWFVNIVGKIFSFFRSNISTWEDIIQFDPLLGWRAKANIDVHMNIDGVYRMTTGEDGWRGNYSLKESNVLIIGDSFVFGQGADDKNHFASLTKKSRVKPIGAPGYGLVHYLLLLKSLSSELKGKLVIWFVYTGNDYRESIRPSSYGYHFPFVFLDQKTDAWKIRTDHITKKRLPFHFEKGYKTSMPELADLFSRNYLSDYAFGAFEYLAKEAKIHCEKHGAVFAVVTLPIRWLIDGSYVHKLQRHSSDPNNFSIHYPDLRAEEICKRLAIPFRAGFSDFSREDFLPVDLHWSKQGNEKAATIIDEIFSFYNQHSQQKNKLPNF